jgi:hypothetical protein
MALRRRAEHRQRRLPPKLAAGEEIWRQLFF